MINNQFPFDESQLIVSYDLLNFINQLVKNDPTAIKKLVEIAQENGYLETKEKYTASDNVNLQESISAFFLLLEEALIEAVEQKIKSTLPPSFPSVLINTVEAIDSSSCDNETLIKSTARTQRALKQNTKQNPKELFYREFLKSWKPRKKSLFH